jgi:hypothetical protein
VTFPKVVRRHNTPGVVRILKALGKCWKVANTEELIVGRNKESFVGGGILPEWA